MVINNIWDIRISKGPSIRAYKSKEEKIRVGQGIIKMVWVPGGTFQMECHSGKVSEGISRTVTLSNYLMGETEVTQAQYQAVTNKNPSRFKGDDNRPVESVSWYDAVSFCNQLSATADVEPCYNLSTWECAFSKKGFRLPSEAEWEYVCRAGTRTDYYSGDSESDPNQVGWHLKNANGATHTVKLKRPNEWGFYDMHGNVCEWCNDWFLTTYYRFSSMYNPEGPPVGNFRVCRGGSWVDGDDNSCKSNYRKFNGPAAKHDSMGFRVVRRP